MSAAKFLAKAYLAPFVAFMSLLALGELVAKLFDGDVWWVVASPRYWVMPLQTLVCGALLAWLWRVYGLRAPARVGFTVAVAVLVWLIWISPQAFLGFPPRRDGFDPAFFGNSGWPFALNVGLRFVRLVIVVPLLEEIFWRGFLLRFAIREEFETIPFGHFEWRSFAWVTVLFALAHAGPDFIPALITGALYNLVAYRTRSLASCVLAHAITNLLLGIFIMRTGQWGFW